MISYVHGDATHPHGEGMKIITHICNDQGGWGAGFVLALSERWPDPENSYRRWYREGADSIPPFALGNVQYVQVEADILVANMVAQHGYMRRGGAFTRPGNAIPLDYTALHQCLADVANFARDINASIHGPRFGAGLAGGNWREIEKIIDFTMSDLSVTIYDLPL